MKQDQRVILNDALSCLDAINVAAGIQDYTERVSEIVELLNRARDDIRTVIRMDK